MAKLRVELQTKLFNTPHSVRVRLTHKARTLLKKQGFKVSAIRASAATNFQVAVDAQNCDAAHWAVLDALRAGGMKVVDRVFTTEKCVFVKRKR